MESFFFIFDRMGKAVMTFKPVLGITPGPHLVRISLVRFPLVRSFKKIQKYSAHADSSVGALTSGGISMR